MKDIINILFVVPNAGISKKSGLPYDMRMAQCVVEKVNKETGAPEPLIGELLLPKEFADIPPGRYEVEFESAISQVKRVESRVSKMTLIPNNRGSAVPPAAPAKA